MARRNIVVFVPFTYSIETDHPVGAIVDDNALPAHALDLLTTVPEFVKAFESANKGATWATFTPGFK